MPGGAPVAILQMDRIGVWNTRPVSGLTLRDPRPAGVGPRRLRPLGASLGGWLALGISVGMWLWVTAHTRDHQPFHVGLRGLRFFDLAVYRGAAERLLHGGDLYAPGIVGHFGFTYPPFSALVLAPLGWLSFAADKVIVTLVNLGALVAMLAATLRLGGVGGPAVRRLGLAAGLAAVLLWLEPVTVTLGYGQIDLVIGALILADLARPPDARGAGIGLGLAAGLKLTPLLFLPFLFGAGRRRAARNGLLSFGLTAGVSLITPGTEGWRYWFGGVAFDSSRVGGADDVANQSLRGALARWCSAPHPGGALLLVVALVGLIGLGLAVTAARRGRFRLGVSLTAVTTLLVSPISWTHHWVLAVPALVLLGLGARERRSGGRAVLTLLGLGIGFAYWPDRWFNEKVPHGLASTAADPYVVAGLLTLVLGGLALRRTAGST